jgi:DNA invertase Pin-like site-specific DNA recombinase
VLAALGESIDTTTTAGRLQLHILLVISLNASAFENGCWRGGRKLGRPKAVIPVDRVTNVSNLPLTEAAVALGVSRSTLKRWASADSTIP